MRYGLTILHPSPNNSHWSGDILALQKKENSKWRSLPEKLWSLFFETRKEFFWSSLCWLGQPQIQLSIVRLWENFVEPSKTKQKVCWWREFISCMQMPGLTLPVIPCVIALLNQFSWDVISHPYYCPDLVPSDYYLFLNLRKHLGGKKIETWKVEDRSHLIPANKANVEFLRGWHKKTSNALWKLYLNEWRLWQKITNIYCT